MTLTDLTPDTLREIGSRAEAWAELFKLPLGHRVWKGSSGDHHGSGTGSSLDFQDHRTYVPGDDPRHINWQAYARSGNYTMKLYREEVRPMVDLVLDVSASMFVEEAKRLRSLELFYFLTHAILKSGASGHFFLTTPAGSDRLLPEAIHGHAWLERAQSLEPGESSSAPELRSIPFRAQSMRLFVSDLLFQGEADPVLRALAKQRGFGVIFAPFTRAESDPPWSGNYEFIDSEDGSRHARRVQLDLLQQYRLAYRRHFDHWKDMGRKYDVSLIRVPSETDFTEAMRFEAVRTGALEFG